MNIILPRGSGRGMIGKLIMSGFGLFFAFIGTQFVRQEWNSLLEVKAMQDWSATTCIIVKSEVVDDGEDFRMNLVYQYDIDDQTFTGSRYGRRSHYTAETIGEIKETQKRLAAGSRQTCFYDPDNIGRSVLTLPTVKGARASLGFTMLFPAFGLFFASIPWLGRGRKKTARTETTPPARSPKKFPIIFGAVFAIFATVMIKPLLITPLLKTKDAQNWNTVPATVVSSKVKSHSSDDGTTYSVYIAYQYMVGGQAYYGDRYTFMGGSSSGYKSKAEIVRQYPEGHEFRIFVNPADPAESVILRDYSFSLLFGLIPVAFLIIGVVIVVFGIRNKKPELDMAQSRERIVELKSSSPLKKALGLSLFTLLWLGIVFFLARSDAPRMFPIVFGFFGLLLIVASIHAVLQIFTPKPTVEITPGNMHPGISAAMRWRLSGRIDQIESLTIKLRCLKVVTETRRSGRKTSTSIVKKPLFENDLLTTDNQHELPQGTLEFAIPAEYPSSRPGNDNGIQWLLEFHGRIARWPDMKYELPFTVYPEG